MRELQPGRGRPVGDDVPAQHGAPDHLARSSAQARRAHRRRRLRPEPGARGVDAIPSLGVDFIVRGEGDLTFRELLRALEGRRPLVEHRRALVSRRLTASSATRPRPVDDARTTATIRPAAIAPRACCPATRCMGRPIDVVETSRGCTFDCSFCSIIEMRGRNFHRFPIERVIADIRDARDRGARAIFIVDDNITLDVAAVRGAVPRDHRRRPQRHRLHRAGDDRVDCRARRRRWRR